MVDYQLQAKKRNAIPRKKTTSDPILRLRDRYNASQTFRLIVVLIMLVLGLKIVLAGAYAIGSMNLGIFVVGGFIAAIGGIMMVLRPDVAMIILVASVYTNSSDVLERAFGIPSLNQALIAVAFLSVIGTRAVIQKRPLRFGITEMAIALYMAMAIVSLFAAGEVGEGIYAIEDFAKDFVIVLVIVQLCAEERTWKQMQWTLLASAGILGTMTVYQTLTGNYEFEFWGYAKVPFHQIVGNFDSARPTGPLDDPNYYSQILLFIQPIAFYRWYAPTVKTLWPRLLAFIFWANIVLTAIFSYSRSAFLMLVAIMIIIVLERKMDIFKVAVGAFVLITAITPFLPDGYTDRISTLTGVFQSAEMQTEASFEGRTSQAVVAMKMFQQNAITGVGYSLYEENYLEYSAKVGLDQRGEARAAHSIYLEVMAETGLMGMITFGFMLYIFYSVSQKAVRDLTAIGRADLVPWIRGIQLGFLSYLLTSIFLHDDWPRHFRLGLGLMATCSVMADSVIKKHHEKMQRMLFSKSESESIKAAQ